MNKSILRLAIPNIISNITVPLLGMVDLSVVGHLEQVYFIGAVSLGTTIFNFIFWGFAFLRMSTSGITAQLFGAKDKSGTTRALHRAALTALLFGLIILLLQIPIDKISFYLLNGSERTEYFASRYFYIRIWAAPATLLLYVLNGWFLGMQNARYPMIIALVINTINIILDFLFVSGFGMNSDGVALGTLIANYSGLAVAIYFLRKKYPETFRFEAFSSMLNLKELKSLFNLNLNIFIRTVCLIVVFTFFTARSAVFGDNILAVNTLLLQFHMFFSYLIDGFAFAAEALTGRYAGASNPFKLKKAIKSLFTWGLLISIPFSLGYFFFGRNIFSVLTDNQTVIRMAEPYFLWIVVMPLLSFPAFLWDGIYIGTTSSRGMRDTMLLSTLVFFFPVWYFTQNALENHSFWLALAIFMISRGVTMTIFAKKYIFKDSLISV